MVSIENAANHYIKKAEDHAELLAFLFQLTQKDIKFATTAGGKWSTFTVTQKVEDVINMVTGRITGFNMFPAVSNYPQTFSLQNGWNPTTMLGVLLWIAGQAVGDQQWHKIGRKIAIGGFIGGVFDDPIATSQTLLNVVPGGSYSPAVRNGLPVGGPTWTGQGGG